MTAVHSADALAAHIFHAVGGRIVTGAADDTAYREVLAGERRRVPFGAGPCEGSKACGA